METGVQVVVALAATLTAWYAYGRRVNLRKQSEIWKILSERLKGHAKKVNFRRLGSSAFQISFPGSPPVSRVEFTAILMDRENLIHYIVQKLQKRKDELFLRASFHCKPDLNLKLAKAGNGLSSIGDIEIAGLRLYSDKPGLAARLMLDKKVRGCLEEMESRLKGLSIAPLEPHIIIRCEVDPEIVDLMLSVTKRIASLCCASGTRA